MDTSRISAGDVLTRSTQLREHQNTIAVYQTKVVVATFPQTTIKMINTGWIEWGGEWIVLLNAPSYFEKNRKWRFPKSGFGFNVISL